MKNQQTNKNNIDRIFRNAQLHDLKSEYFTHLTNFSQKGEKISKNDFTHDLLCQR